MSPEKKRKKKTTKTPSLIHSETSQSTPSPSLPDDLLLSCFARVSRLYYPTLSLVSKSFRSLIASPELYKIRSSLGCTESCLYVCLEKSRLDDTNPRWFTLCRKPDRILNKDIIEKRKKKPNGYVLAEIPRDHSRVTRWADLVAVGSNIYNIGGLIDSEHSSSVSILDCTSNTWHEAPNMRVERKYPTANVLDGKIYVAGCCNDCVSSSSNWMEVFDPKTQTWESVSSPGAGICSPSIYKSAVIEGEICMFGVEGLAYKPKEHRWRMIEFGMEVRWAWYSFCVIEDVLYSYDRGQFKWYGTKVRVWRTLKGVKGLPRFARCGGKMVDYDGKMAVFWDKIVTCNGDKNKMIWCAVIALERCNSEEIWGKVQWHDAVLSVPMSYKVNLALAPIV